MPARSSSRSSFSSTMSSSPPREHKITISPSLSSSDKSYASFSSYQRDENDGRSFASEGLGVSAVNAINGNNNNNNNNNSNNNNNHHQHGSIERISALLGMSDGSSDSVYRWLSVNDFDSDAMKELNGYTLEDLLSLSKSDVKDLLGVKSGIRLYNRLKSAKQEAAEKRRNSSTSSPPSHRPISSHSNQYSDDSLPRSINDNNNNNNLSHSPKADKPYLKRFNGTLIECEVPDCSLYAITSCARIFDDGSLCDKQLCMVHSNKSLVSGQCYCDPCNHEQTSFNQLRNSLQYATNVNNCRTQ